VRGRHRGERAAVHGKEYLESPRDGREVYVYRERVKDVATHPIPGLQDEFERRALTHCSIECSSSPAAPFAKSRARNGG